MALLDLLLTAMIWSTHQRARRERSLARTNDLAPIIEDLRASGIISLSSIAKALSDWGIPTARGGSKWQPAQVSRLLERISHK